MKHLSQKQYIALMLDLAEEQNREIFLKHLEVCKECRKQYNSLTAVIKPWFKNKATLPEMLKKRILKSAIQIRESKRELPKILTILQKQIGLYASIAACTAALAIFGVILFLEINSSNAYLQVDRVYGKADIDIMPARLLDTVTSGDTISTDDDSAMMLRFSRDYMIMIMGKSSLTIDKAKVNKKKNFDVKYSLDKGILVSKYDRRNNTSINNSFVTPHALINAKDADLMLQTSNKTSSIILIKGTLTIRDKNSSKRITIDSPGRYIISDGIKMTRALTPTARDIQTINEAFNSNEEEDKLISNDGFSINQSSNDHFKNSENELIINNITKMLSEDAAQPSESDTEEQ